MFVVNIYWHPTLSVSKADLRGSDLGRRHHPSKLKRNMIDNLPSATVVMAVHSQLSHHQFRTQVKVTLILICACADRYATLEVQGYIAANVAQHDAMRPISCQRRKVFVPFNTTNHHVMTRCTKTNHKKH